MLDAPIGEGADIFVTIVICLIAFVAGIMHIDIFKAFNKKSEEKEK